MFVVQNYEDGTHFQGMQQYGMKNGYGRLVYPDGVYYQGNFKNDTLEGKGSLFYGKERPAYVGDWVNNKFHGKGTLYNEYPVPLYQGFDFKDFNVLGDCWVKYEGTFGCIQVILWRILSRARGELCLRMDRCWRGCLRKGC